MTIIAVDNHYDRLGEFVHCLRAAYPDDTIIDFTDPFRAVQYCSTHKAGIIFVDSGLRPFDACEFAELAISLCSGVKIYIVIDSMENCGDIVEESIFGMAVRPFSRKSLQIPVDN